MLLSPSAFSEHGPVQPWVGSHVSPLSGSQTSSTTPVPSALHSWATLPLHVAAFGTHVVQAPSTALHACGHIIESVNVPSTHVPSSLPSQRYVFGSHAPWSLPPGPHDRP